jgi:hypothetical protein
MYGGLIMYFSFVLTICTIYVKATISAVASKKTHTVARIPHSGSAKIIIGSPYKKQLQE